MNKIKSAIQAMFSVAVAATIVSAKAEYKFSVITNSTTGAKVTSYLYPDGSDVATMSVVSNVIDSAIETVPIGKKADKLSTGPQLIHTKINTYGHTYRAWQGGAWVTDDGTDLEPDGKYHVGRLQWSGVWTNGWSFLLECDISPERNTYPLDRQSARAWYLSATTEDGATPELPVVRPDGVDDAITLEFNEVSAPIAATNLEFTIFVPDGSTLKNPFPPVALRYDGPDVPVAYESALPVRSLATPLMASGSGDSGSYSQEYASGDHVHPAETEVVEFRLPDNCFPITYTDLELPSGQQSRTVTSNEGIRFEFVNNTVILHDIASEAASGYEYGFSSFSASTLKWGSLDAPIENLKFNNTAPTANTWPVLEKDAVFVRDVRVAKQSDIPSIPVTSVNSKTGAVSLTASDVGALPADSEAANNIEVYTSSPGVYALKITDSNNTYYLYLPVNTTGTLALLEDIAVKSVKLNGVALVPDANGAVNIVLTTGDLDYPVSGGSMSLTIALDDIFGALNDKAPLASPAFTGTPTAPDIGTNTTSQIATKNYVDNRTLGNNGDQRLYGTLEIMRGGPSVPMLIEAGRIVLDDDSVGRATIDIPYRPFTTNTFAFVSDIAVKSVKLNGTALTPDANGAVDVQAIAPDADGYVVFPARNDGNYLMVDGVHLRYNGGPDGDSYIFDTNAEYSESVARFRDIYAAINQIAPDFTAKAYAQYELCSYNGVVYRCTSAYTATAQSTKPPSDTTHWEAKKVSELFVPCQGRAFTNGNLHLDCSTGEGVMISSGSGGAIKIGGQYYGVLLNPYSDTPIRIHWPNASGTLALLSDMYEAVQQIAPAWVSGTTYNTIAKVSYNGVVYARKTGGSLTSSTDPATDTTNWEAKTVSDLFLPLTGGTMTGTLKINSWDQIQLVSGQTLTEYIGQVCSNIVNSVSH